MEMEARHNLPAPSKAVQFAAPALFAVVVWISGSQISGAFQCNFVLRYRAACLSLCSRLRLASSLLGDFVSKVGIGAAN
jgi:hypothetical protein